MKLCEQAYLEKKAAELGMTAIVAYGPINQDVEIITLSDGKHMYQFGVTWLEMLQNEGKQMENLIDCRIHEAVKKPRKPRFDTVNVPISEMAQRANQ